MTDPDSSVEALFLEVVDLDPTERSRILDERCAGKPDLRREVESYLFADGLNEDGQLEVPPHDAGGEERPVRVAGYEIVSRIGQGGMGTVYRATQERPKRTVALKLIRAGLATPAVLRRFELEAELLGRLQHVGIAHVYEAGIGRVEYRSSASDQPYLAMELIEGAPLLEWVKAQGLDTEAKLGLVARICDAVHHAHQAGVIHRDLKPGNILVDAGGQPKVLDFGAARLSHGELASITATLPGQIIGTLQYMSPEQASGDSSQIDTRSDVYALGAILYELLAGRPAVDVRGGSIAESILRVQRGVETTLATVVPALRGDVSTIAGKALERDRDRRYDSASELASDLRRHLDDLPIHARPPTTLYQLRKFARRHRPAVAAAAGILLALVAGVVGIAVYAQREAAARVRSERMHYELSLISASLAVEEGRLAEARELLERVADDPLAGWEMEHLRTRLDQSVLTVRFEERGIGRDRKLPFELAPDGGRATLLYDVGGRMAACVMETRGWTPVGRSPDAVPIPFNAQALPDGEHVAYLPEGEDALHVLSVLDGSVERVETAAPGTLVTHELAGPPGQTTRIAFFGELPMFRYPGMEHWQFLERDEVADLPGIGAVVVTLPGDRRTYRVHRLETGEELFSFRGADVWGDCRFSPDGSLFAAGSKRGQLAVWRVEDGSELAWSPTAEGSTDVWSIDFSPDGAHVVTAGPEGVVRIRDVRTGVVVRSLRGHAGGVLCAQFSPDGESLVSASVDGSVRVWGDPDSDPLVLGRHDSYVYPVAFSPDGARVASGGWDGTVRLWDATSGASICTLHLSPQREPRIAFDLAYSPDGSRLLVVAGAESRNERSLIVFDADTGERIAELEAGPAAVIAAADGQVAVSSQRGTELYDVRELSRTIRIDGAGGACAFSPRSPSRLAVVEPDSGRAAIRSLDSGESIAVLEGHARAIHSLGFDPSGRRVVSASGDATARVWDARTGAELAVLGEHAGEVFDAKFSPDGRRIATAGRSGVIRLWDAESFHGVGSFRGHESYVYSLAWSPDGTRLVSGSGDGTVRVWETAPLSERVLAERARAELVERLESWVAERLAAAAEPRAAVREIRGAGELGEREREVALQIALRRLVEGGG